MSSVSHAMSAIVTMFWEVEGKPSGPTSSMRIPLRKSGRAYFSNKRMLFSCMVCSKRSGDPSFHALPLKLLGKRSVLPSQPNYDVLDKQACRNPFRLADHGQ